MISHVKDIAKAHVLSLKNKRAGGRRLIVGSEVRSILELSQIMAKNIPSHAKKLPKRELPNFMVKLLSYVDTSAKNMVPDLGLKMQTDQTYAEDILQMKFKASEIAVVDAAKSVIRLNLA
jgi:dihydroflavonol-4-reductase